MTLFITITAVIAVTLLAALACEALYDSERVRFWKWKYGVSVALGPYWFCVAWAPDAGPNNPIPGMRRAVVGPFVFKYRKN